MECRAKGSLILPPGTAGVPVDRINNLSSHHRRRAGFTLIELMVAIGIILILVAVSIAGISQVSKHTKSQRTQTSLETARSLMAGYVASDSTQSALKQM